jgi:hypothetical protein
VSGQPGTLLPVERSLECWTSLLSRTCLVKIHWVGSGYEGHTASAAVLRFNTLICFPEARAEENGAPTRSIMLNDKELARVESIAPFLLSEAKTALEGSAGFEFTMELEMHVQPGLRIRSPVNLDDDPDSPPFPLDLFVGLPSANCARWRKRATPSARHWSRASAQPSRRDCCARSRILHRTA